MIQFLLPPNDMIVLLFCSFWMSANDSRAGSFLLNLKRSRSGECLFEYAPVLYVNCLWRHGRCTLPCPNLSAVRKNHAGHRSSIAINFVILEGRGAEVHHASLFPPHMACVGKKSTKALRTTEIAKVDNIFPYALEGCICEQVSIVHVGGMPGS